MRQALEDPVLSRRNWEMLVNAILHEVLPSRFEGDSCGRIADIER